MSRRFRRRPSFWQWSAVAIAAALTVRALLSQRRETPIALTPGTATVAAVIDGRTLRISPQPPGDAQVAVRLLGIEIIDESAAREYLGAKVVGHSVRIELDKRRRDTDGAQFAYVYSGDTLLNAELVRQGWAKAKPYPGDSARHAKLLREASTHR